MQKSIMSKIAKELAREAKTILENKYGSRVEFGKDGAVYLDREYIGNLDACNPSYHRKSNSVEFAHGSQSRVI